MPVANTPLCIIAADCRFVQQKDGFKISERVNPVEPPQYLDRVGNTVMKLAIIPVVTITLEIVPNFLHDGLVDVVPFFVIQGLFYPYRLEHSRIDDKFLTQATNMFDGSLRAISLRGRSVIIGAMISRISKWSCLAAYSMISSA
jgi:hypothetical protein